LQRAAGNRAVAGLLQRPAIPGVSQAPVAQRVVGEALEKEAASDPHKITYDKWRAGTEQATAKFAAQRPRQGR
jgi:hypothetical protein